MNLLDDIKALHDKWDARGGQSGDDKYEDALYDCINELADVIIKHESASQPVNTADAEDRCPKCGHDLIMDVCETGCGYIKPRR
jgi:hypothetical protein